MLVMTVTPPRLEMSIGREIFHENLLNMLILPPIKKAARLKWENGIRHMASK